MDFKDIPKFTSEGSWQCDYPLVNAIGQLDEWIVKDNLQLCPDFQRGHVWTEEQQVKFIEYLLRGGKTGKVLYFNHPGWTSNFEGDFVLVDGLQRSTAIRRFINNEIRVFGHLFKEFTGKSRIFISFNINNLQTRKEVLKWYLDMNYQGTPHSHEELDRVRELLDKE